MKDPAANSRAQPDARRLSAGWDLGLQLRHHDPPSKNHKVTGASNAVRWKNTCVALREATIPAGCASGAHVHLNCESALYIIQGHGKFMVGEKLDQAIEFGPGDYLFVPPGAPHQPVNDGTEAIEMVVARNTPVEIVEEYPTS